jgi:hypothetical protein
VPGANRPKAEDVVQAGIEALTELNVLAHDLRNQISRENDAEESLHLIAKFFARCGYLDIYRGVKRTRRILPRNGAAECGLLWDMSAFIRRNNQNQRSILRDIIPSCGNYCAGIELS